MFGGGIQTPKVLIIAGFKILKLSHVYRGSVDVDLGK
jgi:hypothetical protein